MLRTWENKIAYLIDGDFLIRNDYCMVVHVRMWPKIKINKRNILAKTRNLLVKMGKPFGLKVSKALKNHQYNWYIGIISAYSQYINEKWGKYLKFWITKISILFIYRAPSIPEILVKYPWYFVAFQTLLVSSSWRTCMTSTRTSPQRRLKIIYLRNYTLLHSLEFILVCYCLLSCLLSRIFRTMVGWRCHRSINVVIMLSLGAPIQEGMGSLDR